MWNEMPPQLFDPCRYFGKNSVRIPNIKSNLYCRPWNFRIVRILPRVKRGRFTSLDSSLSVFFLFFLSLYVGSRVESLPAPVARSGWFVWTHWAIWSDRRCNRAARTDWTTRWRISAARTLRQSTGFLIFHQKFPFNKFLRRYVSLFRLFTI